MFFFVFTLFICNLFIIIILKRPKKTFTSFKENYKRLKENQSDNVVAYFEERVAESSLSLQAAENRLLKFNQENNIINYYEQTRHISEQKQILESRYYDELMYYDPHVVCHQ